MVFTCNKNELQKALSIAIKATSNKLQKSVLECVLIMAAENMVILKAFDNVMGITATVEADVMQAGNTLLTAKHLNEMLLKLDDGEVSFETREGTVHVTSRNASASFQEVNTDSYQEIPEIDGQRLVISRNDFSQMAEGVTFCAYSGEDNMLLTGILFNANDEGMSMVTSDKVRLAVRKNIASVDEDVKIVIPSKTLRDISRIIEGEGDIELYISENSAHIIVENIQVYTRLLEGEYFDYMRIIPQGYTTRVKVDTTLMAKSMDIASVMARDDLNNMVTLNITQGAMEITASSEYGEVKDTIPIYMEGELTTVSFNGRLLGDILKNIDEQSIYIDLSGKFKPCKIMPTEGDEFLYLIVSVNNRN